MLSTGCFLILHIDLRQLYVIFKRLIKRSLFKIIGMGGKIQAKSFSSSLNVYTPVFVFHVCMTLFVSWLVFHIPETSLQSSGY